MKPYLYIIFVILFLTSLKNFGADTTNVKNKSATSSLGFIFEPGKVLQTHPFVQGVNPEGEAYTKYFALTAKYGIHTDGRKLWQRLYNYPVWGGGLFYGNFKDSSELGTPFALFMFLDIPFKRWQKWSINGEVRFGMSFGWKTHYPFENGFQYPIGSFSTVFADLGIKAVVNLSKNIDLSAGFGFTHFSNGSVKLPNYGLNMIAPKLGVKYIFNKRPEFIKTEKPVFKSEQEWLVLFSPSYRQIAFGYHDENNDSVVVAFDYMIFNLSSTYNYQISHKIKFGAGFDLSYNEAYGATSIIVDGIPEKAPWQFKDKILFGVYPSFELVISKVSLILQPGFYLYRKKTDEGIETPATYQRIGIKYHFSDQWLAGVNVRAFNFTKADFIEFNVGYRIKFKRKKSK